LKKQAAAGEIRLLFQDESEALTFPLLARSWAERGADLRVEAPGWPQKVAMIGCVDAVSRDLLVHLARTKRSTDFIDMLRLVDRRFGPRPGREAIPVVIVIDNGPIHTSKASRAALAARAHWLRVEWLPKYAPELNDIERDWRLLKHGHLANRVWRDVPDLMNGIRDGIAAINATRRRGRKSDSKRRHAA
jgi:transposase